MHISTPWQLPRERTYFSALSCLEVFWYVSDVSLCQKLLFLGFSSPPPGSPRPTHLAFPSVPQLSDHCCPSPIQGMVMGRVVVRDKCRVGHGGFCFHPGLAVPQGIWTSLLPILVQIPRVLVQRM